VTSVAEIQRRLASEFEQQGWEYDLTAGRAIAEAASRAARVDPDALARSVPSSFLVANSIDRARLARAIHRAIGDATVTSDDTERVLVFSDSRKFVLNIGDGAQISHSNFNVGGSLIDVSANGSREQVLEAVTALVAAGLSGNWDSDAAIALGQVVDSRGDIDYLEIEAAAREVTEADPSVGRISSLMTSVAASGLGGALSTGIVAALSAVLSNL
jgi:hypothetical protein